MKIVVSRNHKKWTDFEKKEWNIADKEHYGKVVDWKKKDLLIKVFDGNKIIATLRMEIQAGVAYICAIIVSQIQRNKGIGEKLLEEAEKIAVRNGAHKIYLQTGKDWDTAKFYEKFGYKITSDLPNHLFHQNFVEMTKFL